MSHIISVFKYIISPFRFLWKSSVLSVRKMTKGYNRLSKSDSSLNRDEQTIFSKKETQKIEHDDKKNSSHDNLRQSSQKLLKKLRKITFTSISSNHDEQISNEILEDNSCELVKTIPESNGEFQLKGILKNSTKNSSCNNHQSNESSVKTSDTIDKKENSDDVISSEVGYNHSDSTVSSSKLIKHVRFDDKICKKRYKPSLPVFNVMKLSYRQQKKLQKLHRKDSLNLHAMNLTSGISIDSTTLPECAPYESSEDELNDDDDEED